MFSRTLLVARTASIRMAAAPKFTAPAQQQLVGAFSRRAFSAKTDLLKALEEELQEEKANEADKVPAPIGPFKLSEDLPDKVTLKHVVKGMNVAISFDAAELKYDFDEESEEGAEELHKRLPIRIEITPVASKNSVVVSGEILCRESTTEDNVEDEEDIPFFNPSSCVVGDEASIKLGYTPDIDELSEDVQDSLSNWLTDLEVNEKVFTQAFDLASERENKLYVNWLQGLKSVVEASGKKQ